MKTFYDRVFNATVGIRVSKPDNHYLDASCEVQEKKTKKGILVIYIVTIENKKDFYGLLHETLHLVKNIFADRRIAFTAENDEVIAYYQTYWFKILWRAINKRAQKEVGENEENNT
jgi:hypothetical protein